MKPETLDCGKLGTRRAYVIYSTDRLTDVMLDKILRRPHVCAKCKTNPVRNPTYHCPTCRAARRGKRKP